MSFSGQSWSDVASVGYFDIYWGGSLSRGRLPQTLSIYLGYFFTLCSMTKQSFGQSPRCQVVAINLNTQVGFMIFSVGTWRVIFGCWRVKMQVSSAQCGQLDLLFLSDTHTTAKFVPHCSCDAMRHNSCNICLRNDLYCVGWGIKLYSLQPLCSCDVLLPCSYCYLCETVQTCHF